jgi:hypothetical protein
MGPWASLTCSSCVREWSLDIYSGYVSYVHLQVVYACPRALYDKNIKQVQDFSGHRSIENLLRYLAEVEDTQAILGYRFHNEETIL